MKHDPNSIQDELATLASNFQLQRTGHKPESVAVLLSEDTLVVTLYGALTPVERTLARTFEGAQKVQEFHRQLFANSNDEMRREIARVTGRQVQEAATEVAIPEGMAVHAFTTGAMVQIYLLTV